MGEAHSRTDGELDAQRTLPGLGWAAAFLVLSGAGLQLHRRQAVRRAREAMRRIRSGEVDQVSTLAGCPGVGPLHDELVAMARHLQETFTSRERFRQVVETIPGALLGTDAQGRIVLWNEHARQVTGYDSRQVLGRTCRELGLFDCGTDPCVCPRQSGSPLLQVEMPLKRRDGTETVISKSSTLLSPNDGSAPGTIEVFFDVSEKKRYEDQLLEQRAELEASRSTALHALDDLKRTLRELEAARDAAEGASRLKSQFLANVSHEIRTPLNSIIGFAQLLRDSPLFPEEAEYAETIVRSSGHLKDLIEQVLDLSKIEAGRLEVDVQSFDPRSLALSVDHILRPKALSRKLVFDVDVDPEVPAELCGDATRIRQVLINLVGNAVKFTEQGGVRVRMEWSDGELLLTVSDTGPGIAESHRSRIYEPFFQSDGSTTRQHGGTGLGLAIVRGLVEVMGGTMELDSAIGWGTTFTVRLPGLAASRDAADAAPDRVGTDGARSLCGRGKVLLVEDDPPSAKLVQVVLERAGYQVSWAAGGEEGLDLFALGGWEAMLLDMQMPGIDGYEVARRVRRCQQGQSLPIIALTAHASSGDRERCVAAGCSHYLTKPLDSDALLRLLGELTEGRRAVEETGRIQRDPERELAQLRRQYLERLGAEIQCCIECLDETDPPDVARKAHTWKGSGGTYGFPEVSRRAHALEAASTSGDAAAVRQCLLDLAEQVSDLRSVEECPAQDAEEYPRSSSSPPP